MCIRDRFGTSPLFAALLAIIILGETPTIMLGIGIILVTFGIILITKSK